MVMNPPIPVSAIGTDEDMDVGAATLTRSPFEEAIIFMVRRGGRGRLDRLARELGYPDRSSFIRARLGEES